MSRHPTLFLTHRSQFHQQNILAAAPEELDITIRRDASPDEILQLLPVMEFLITEREDVIDTRMISAGRNLRLIQRLGSQTWDIDLEAARQAGIPVCYWPYQSVINVAEHALLLSLNLIKKMRELCEVMNEAAWTRPPRQSDEDTFAYNWTSRKGIGTLRLKTAGILGFGEIGRELALRLKGFECQVLYHKRRRMPEEAERQLGITYASQEELAARSDVLYCLLPFSPESAQSLDAGFFTRMKPGACFVFCGGGGLVDEAALCAALRSGHLAGAGLDTYTYEPLPADSPLLALYRDLSVNLILTPHVAAGTLSASRTGDFTNLVRLLAGQELLYRVA
jgi:phosphoglycerate dehydrogenase-like enzyme